jgi:bla regulator protein blaR1
MRAVGLLALVSTVVLGLANVLLTAQTTSGEILSARPNAMPAWQAAAGKHMEFEVASIRLGEPGKFTPPNIALNIDDESIATGGRFFADFPLPVYVEFAYKLMLTREERETTLAHLPKWVVSQPFVIEARAPTTNVTKDQMRLMMQALLAERFKLSIHFETRQSPAFALVTIKPGTTGKRLRPHSEGLACDEKWIAPADPSSPSVPPGGFLPTCGGVLLIPGPNHSYILGSRGITMNHLAQYLPTLIPFGRPIIDRTGLRGNFDFSLEFAPERIAPNSGADVQSEPPGTTAFEALKEQLGLALKPIKAPLPVLIIDHVEQPSPN